MLAQRILNLYQSFSRSKTHVQLVKTSSLSEAQLEHLWLLFQAHHTITHEEFLTRCREKCEWTALFRDTALDELVGFMGVRYREVVLDSGEKTSTLYFGHGFISPAYRGQHLIQRTVLSLYLKCLLTNPTQRVFIWSNALTVRPYLLTARDLHEYYPHPSMRWPEDVLEIRNQLGRHYYGEDFDETHGVVHKHSRYISQHALHIHPEKMQDPHVQLYVRLNPGYIHGNGLLTIQPATLKNLTFYMQRISTRILASSAHQPRQPMRETAK